MTKKPVVLVVMDGMGLTESKFGNAVAQAKTPTLDYLYAAWPHTRLRAHGLAVGLPSEEDMGNSEVGHNAIGCGQIYSQGAKLVNENIESGELFNSKTWKELVAQAKGHTMHFMGLLSDGNVHSNISHLKALLVQAKKEGVNRVRLHVLLDGRDVPDTSALLYVDDIEATMASLNDASFDACIASGGGRMQITMDRYEADWAMVKRGWDLHVLGQGRQFESCKQAIETYREELGVIDQDLPGFVVAQNGQPVGTIEDGDAVILFNFRGDRALEISKAFDDADFTHFDRVRHPKVLYAGMLQYDADLNIPVRYLTEPPKIQYTLTEELCKHGLKEFAVSETQKYGHVTYFWNGNRSEKFDENLETYLEIKSDVIPFEQRPWMKAAEITDATIQAIESGEYDFIRLNYPNGDMVGHTGSLDATILAVEAVDQGLARLLPVVQKAGGVLLITADHGNADEMYQAPKPGKLPAAKTSHTLNRVPFIVFNKKVKLKTDDELGLANIAATVTDLLGIPANEHWKESILR